MKKIKYILLQTKNLFINQRKDKNLYTEINLYEHFFFFSYL